MKQFILFLSALTIVSNALAQQLPVSAHFFTEANLENPALVHRNFIKYDMPLSIDLGYRYQWVDLEEAPRTAIGKFQYFNEDFNVFFGGSIISDITHPTSFTGLMIHGAYRIRFNRSLYGTVGLRGGIYQYAVKGADLIFLEQDDVASQNINKFVPDLSIGASLYWKNKFFIGLSIPQALGFDIHFKDGNSNFNIQRVPHYYLQMGGIFSVYNESWLEPSISIKYLPELPLFYELLLKYERQELFWVGVGGANSGNMHLEAGFILKGGGINNNLFRIGYGFNSYFNSYGVDFGPTHEIKFTF